MTVDDVLANTPEDDAGSETLARYDFQVSLTAMACIGMLLDDSVIEIICEWEEDYIVRRTDQSELVSVKHREPSQGAWTLATLIESGGLKHLFDRWKRVGKAAKCRLQTNGGLKAGPKEASAVVEAAVGERTDEVAKLISGKIGADSDEEAAEFLRSLTIEAELPKRDDLRAKVVSAVLPRHTAELGWESDEVTDRFEAIRAVVAVAATSDLRAERRDLRLGLDDATAEARALAKKTVTRAKIASACAGLGRSPSRLTQKLERGGLGPTDVERCQRLRSRWLAEENRWDSGLPGPSPFAEARDVVQDLAVVAEAEARDPDERYAAPMRSRLAELLEGAGVMLDGRPADVDLLLGAAYDETDRCRIWWSDRFPLAVGVTPDA